ncbi:hypothetical protein HDU97_000480 [Phlyctochytrium planicorne]|nr:hypothetical protein HDU97_000480 [Phlyctochytrium planicorne]
MKIAPEDMLTMRETSTQFFAQTDTIGTRERKEREISIQLDDEHAKPVPDVERLDTKHSKPHPDVEPSRKSTALKPSVSFTAIPRKGTESLHPHSSISATNHRGSDAQELPIYPESKLDLTDKIRAFSVAADEYTRESAIRVPEVSRRITAGPVGKKSITAISPSRRHLIPPTKTKTLSEMPFDAECGSQILSSLTVTNAADGTPAYDTISTIGTKKRLRMSSSLAAPSMKLIFTSMADLALPSSFMPLENRTDTFSQQNIHTTEASSGGVPTPSERSDESFHTDPKVIQGFLTMASMIADSGSKTVAFIMVVFFISLSPNSKWTSYHSSVAFYPDLLLRLILTPAIAILFDVVGIWLQSRWILQFDYAKSIEIFRAAGLTASPRYFHVACTAVCIMGLMIMADAGVFVATPTYFDGRRKH